MPQNIRKPTYILGFGINQSFEGPSSTDIEFESESTETKFNLPCTAKPVRCFIEGQVKVIHQCHLFVGLSYQKHY